MLLTPTDGGASAADLLVRFCICGNKLNTRRHVENEVYKPEVVSRLSSVEP